MMIAIELVCVAILLAGVALRARLPGLEQWRTDSLPIFAGAWLAEDSCIRLYGFYDYATAAGLGPWHGLLDQVPLLVPTIWIFVVLSARDVARVLAPGAVLPLAFAIIWYDASLIEPIATTVGLWRWHEAGPFAVPWIGMLGWALYGLSALAWLERLPGRWRWATALLAPLTTHALLLVAWWGGLRWIGREAPLPEHAAGIAGAVALILAGALVATGRVGAVPLGWLLPRIAPALFFFGLLAVHHAPPPLWGWAAAFTLPWLVGTGWRRPAILPDTVRVSAASRGLRP